MHRHLTYLIAGTVVFSVVACGDEDEPLATPELAITTTMLPDGSEGVDYQVEVEATGGSGEDYRWSLAGGGLPTGVFLRSEGTPSTIITGRPRSGGTATFTLRVTDSEGNEAIEDLSITIEEAPPSVAITTTMLPEGAIDQAYTATITAENGTGYSWRLLSGELPPGLELAEQGTPSTTLSGVPELEGGYTFTIRVEDSEGNRDDAQFRIEVFDRRPELAITPARLDDALVSVPYREDLVASGGSLTGYTWELVSGELPPGLTLAESGTPNAAITGVPTLRGSYSFRVEVVDSEGNDARESFFIEVAPAPPPLSIQTFELPAGRVAEPYGAELRAVNGVTDEDMNGEPTGYTWSVEAPAPNDLSEDAIGGLPSGLTLVGGTPTASLEGTPEQDGAYEFVIRVQDLVGSVSARSYRVEIAQEILPVTITATTPVLVLPNAEGGQPYTATLEAEGGAPLPPNAGEFEVRYNWVVTGGELPPGLSLDPVGQGPDDAGSFVGVPTALGTYTATVTVYDRVNQTDTQVIQITVDPPAVPLGITTTALDDLPGEGCYGASVSASGGGNAGFTWRVVSGTLPPGIELETTGTPSARLGGFPTQPSGTYTFEIEVEDTFGLTATREFTIGVAPTVRGPDRWSVVVADLEVDDQFDIFAQDMCALQLGTPVRVNASASFGDVSSASRDTALSPNGDALAFMGDLDTDNETDVYVVDLRDGAQTGEAVRILDASGTVQEAIDLRWSPDGSKIAIRYDSQTSGSDELWVADVSNLAAPEQAVRVSQPGTSSSEDTYDEYAFSPDGTKIAWVGDNAASSVDEMWVVDLSGATPSAPESCSPSGVSTSQNVEQRGFIWTPDSRGVVYTADIADRFDPDLYFCDASGTPPYAVTSFANTVGRPDTEGNSSMEQEDHLSFSANGDRMFYIADVTGSFEYDLFVVSYDSTTGLFSTPTNITQITASSGEVRSARWAESGYQILVQGDLQSSSRDEVFVFDGGPTATSGQSLIPVKSTQGSTSLEASLSWNDWQLSPDGTTVALIGDFDSSGVDELYVVDVSSGPPYSDDKINQSLSSSANDVYTFDWLPDSSGVVYEADPTSSQDELFYVDLRGTTPASPVRLHPPYTDPNQDVFGFGMVGDARVLILGDIVSDGDTGAYFVDFPDGVIGELQSIIGGPLESGRDVNLLLSR